MRYVIRTENTFSKEHSYFHRTSLGIEWVYDIYDATFFHNMEEAEYWVYYATRNCTIAKAEVITVEIKEIKNATANN